MAVEQVWDTTTTDSTSEELAYFFWAEICCANSNKPNPCSPIAAHVRLASESKWPSSGGGGRAQHSRTSAP